MSVPLCLRGRFTVTSSNGNEYTTNITDIVPQRYSSPSGAQTYTGSNIQVGMYASTSSDGRIFRIKTVGTRTATSLTGAILEDVDGLNKKFDSNGNQVGNPENGGGYIFELNSEGLPMLTNVGDPLSPQFTDSLMGRFLYDRNSVRNVGQYRSIQVFARGTGKNVTDVNNGGEPYARRVVLNGTIISEESGDTTKRGLYLTILNATNFSHISTTQYNTSGSDNNPAINLGNALNSMTRQQIGILTSYREWESKIESSVLISAALRLGLTKLATFKNTTNSGRPYAAIFYGGGIDTTNVGTHDVIERMESNDGDAPLAIVTAILITDGTFASIVGPNSTNSLYSADSTIKDPLVMISSSNKMGIGTTDPLGKLTIKGIADATSAIVMLNGSGNGQTRAITGGVVSNEIIGLSDTFTSANGNATDAGQLRLSAGGGTNAGTKAYIDMYGYAGNPPELGHYIAMGTRGTERVRIDQNGNVGVGVVPNTTLAPVNQLKLDVNGYVRGKGTIVNTVLLKPADNDIWTSYSEPGANPISHRYVPIQTGNVNLVVHAGIQLALLNGYGTDDIAADVYAVREVTINRIVKFGNGNAWAVFNIAPSDSNTFNGLGIIAPGDAYVKTEIEIKSQTGMSAGNVGKFNVTSSGTTSGVGLGYGYYVQFVNSAAVDQSFGLSGFPTVYLRTGTLKRYNAQYVGGSSYGTSRLNDVYRGWQSYHTMQDAVHVTTSVPITFTINAQYGSGDRTFFDIPAYRNTYMVIHEISNT